ncbi:hypothetical protein PTT03_10660 [Serratia ureilytica]|uniref:ADP-ribosyltransferase n=1 Tax=Serratia ureilytica TaxID=300181 RepID=UPI00313F1639
MLKIGEAAVGGGEAEDISGLASERILYAPQNREDLKLYNVPERELSQRPARGASGTPFLGAEKDAAVTAWLDALPADKLAPPKNSAEMESRLLALLKRNQYLTSGQRSQAKSEYRQTVELLHSALESPMFERYSGTFWHGSHAAVAEALLEHGNDARFPGFMSTTYDPAVAKSYMAKGGLIVVQPGEVSGSLVEGNSNAPSEKEVLFPEGMPFSVEQSYVLHFEKGYPPEANSMIKKKRFDLEVANGSKEP